MYLDKNKETKNLSTLYLFQEVSDMTRLAKEAWKHYDEIMNFVYADEE